jgi:hypothetical protein
MILPVVESNLAIALSVLEAAPSVLVATAVAMLLYSVSISVPLTIFKGLPGDKLSLVAKLVDFV